MTADIPGSGPRRSANIAKAVYLRAMAIVVFIYVAETQAGLTKLRRR